MGDLKKIVFDEFTFFVNKNVYEPAEDTFLLAENLQIEEEDVVLDIGTGCGIFAIISAKKARQVVATDINSHAVNCAKRNAKINNVSNKIEFIIGDLFQPIREGKEFSLITFNAPYLPVDSGEIKDWIDYAWTGGPSGRELIDCFIDNASLHLKDGGKILLVQSTLSDVDKTMKRLREKGFNASIVAEHKVMFETIYLIMAVK
jgi:release factor glutamine methyltransferase